MQPGPIYFKTPWKCAIFGVMCEGLPKDEAADAGKGANATEATNLLLPGRDISRNITVFGETEQFGTNKSSYEDRL